MTAHVLSEWGCEILLTDEDFNESINRNYGHLRNEEHVFVHPARVSNKKECRVRSATKHSSTTQTASPCTVQPDVGSPQFPATTSPTYRNTVG